MIDVKKWISEKHCCKNCGKVMTEFFGSGEYCCRSCANTRKHSLKTKQKIGAQVKNFYKGFNEKYFAINPKKEYKLKVALIRKLIKYINYYLIHPKYCTVCNKLLSYKDRWHKTCSQNCSKISISNSLKTIAKNTPGIWGGYRKNSGRGHSGYYKGIWCQSTYELCWVIYALDHNIKFKRFEGKITNGKLTYIPDFILEDNKTIIEIKGYENKELVDAKTKLAESKGFKVNVLWEKDLKNIFNYVELKYHTKKFYFLYDDYKPLYKYKCSWCEKIIFSDNKRTTDTIFCSRKCSGKYRANKNHSGR